MADPVTSAAAGWNIGTGGAEAALKYDRGIYEERLAELNSIKQDLEQHLDTLTNMKNEISGFWDDALGQSLSSTAQQWINNIQEADDKLQSMIVTTEGLIEGLDETLGSADETIESVNAAAKAVTLYNTLIMLLHSYNH